MTRWIGILGLVLAACQPKDDDVGDTDVVDSDDTDVVDSDDTDVVDSDDSDVVPDAACAAVVDRSFASLEPGECGIGPDGVVLCTWHVTFTATDWTWQHSDYGMSGTYTCVDGAITAGSGGGMPIVGTYDPGTDTLTWDGVAYR